jgi:hypothetical protein
MGKRSDFIRVERDYYPTPKNAFIPLLKHLPNTFSFIEPCAGDGRLVNYLTECGGLCINAYDIEPQHSSVSIGSVFDTPKNSPSFFITNPPWERKILHPIITHLTSISPTWLLFDADWAHTKQAREFLTKCVKIVSIGRVKWIEDSKMTGKDNCAWYLFDKQFTGETTFHANW